MSYYNYYELAQVCFRKTIADETFQHARHVRANKNYYNRDSYV